MGELAASSNDGYGISPLAQQVADFEKMVIEQALSSNEGRINETMQQLQVARKTLYDKMQKYGLDKSDFKDMHQ